MKYKFITVALRVLILLNGYTINACENHESSANLTQTKVEGSKRPILTTAGIVHYCPDNKIILIERGKAPFGYAMFGGHVEHESPEAAFKREAKEELNVDVTDLKLVGVYGEPERDPRQHSVEITYSATTNQKPFAGTDAKKTHLFSKEELKRKLANDPKAFAFDHASILKRYLTEAKNPCVKAK